ncbi:hypothetical protein TWF481_004553 [Arthrobotrys musiformis]|uniref:Uncharacterized protein n=1 Tax=Arthrobotrys musiformis TaxID=47236 RepID=A0AAV9WJV2_9PEZI
MQQLSKCLDESKTTQELFDCYEENLQKTNVQSSAPAGNTFKRSNLLSTLLLFSIALFSQPRGSLFFPGGGGLFWRLSPILAACEALLILYLLAINKNSMKYSIKLKAAAILYLRNLPHSKLEITKNSIKHHLDELENSSVNPTIPDGLNQIHRTYRVRRLGPGDAYENGGWEVQRQNRAPEDPRLIEKSDLVDFRNGLGYKSWQIHIFALLGILFAFAKVVSTKKVPMLTVFSVCWLFSWLVVQSLIIIATPSERYPMSKDELQQLYEYAGDIICRTEREARKGVIVVVHFIWYYFLVCALSRLNEDEDDDAWVLAVAIPSCISLLDFSSLDGIAATKANLANAAQVLTIFATILAAQSFFAYIGAAFDLWSNRRLASSKILERLERGSIASISLILQFSLATSFLGRMVDEWEKTDWLRSLFSSGDRYFLAVMFTMLVGVFTVIFITSLDIFSGAIKRRWDITQLVIMLLALFVYVVRWDDKGTSKPDWQDWFP